MPWRPEHVAARDNPEDPRTPGCCQAGAFLYVGADRLRVIDHKLAVISSNSGAGEQRSGLRSEQVDAGVRRVGQDSVGGAHRSSRR